MWGRRAFVATIGTMSLTGMLWTAAAPATAGGGGCLHGTPATDGGGTTVEMVDACFTPTVLHVSQGDTVTFVNRDDFDHTVTGVGGTWGTYDDVHAGERVAATFDENGVYVYSCLLHPGMAGAVVVGDGSGSAGLGPASVQPVEVGDAPAAAADVPVATEGGAGSGAALAALGGLLAAMGIGALAVARRRRSSVLQPESGS